MTTVNVTYFVILILFSSQRNQFCFDELLGGGEDGQMGGVRVESGYVRSSCWLKSRIS